MEDIVIVAKKTKLLGLAIGCLVFEAFFIHFFIYGLPEDRAPFKALVPAASFIGAPMCGVVLIYICFRLLRPGPVVIINREGILDNASIFSAGLIHWHEIKTMFVYRVIDQPMLGIIPFHSDVIIARQSPIKRFFFRMLKSASTTAPFAIPGGMLPMSAEELLAKIHRYREQLPTNSETASRNEKAFS
jgi:hypothetical protein